MQAFDEVFLIIFYVEEHISAECKQTASRIDFNFLFPFKSKGFGEYNFS